MKKKYLLISSLLMLILVNACTPSVNNNESEQIMNGLSTDQIVIPELDQNAPQTYETATFALGWFWGPDSQFGSLNGVIRTRVGYAGGEKTNPTYYSLGNHSETIQIDYDPEIISYEELLEVFWNNHSPTYPAPSDQYKSIIFYNNEEQKEAAELSMQKKQENTNQQILTEIRELKAFYLAEDYHQKYYLRQYQTIYREYARIYPDWQDFTNSAAVTKANGFVGGSSNPDTLEKLASGMGLSDAALAEMAKIVRAHY